MPKKATKILLFDKEAREKLLRGIEITAKAVGSTLGPKGRNVAMERIYGTPDVNHDGVSVAKQIILRDNVENMGVSLVRQAASSTNDVAGDGTTTATILAHSMSKMALEQVERGANAMVMRAGMEDALKAVVAEINKQKIPVDDPEKIKQIAMISAQREDIGEIIFQAISVVGKDGVVSVESGNGRKTEVEYKEGMGFDRGYLSRYFVKDDATQECVMEQPYIFLTDSLINSNAQFVPLMEKLFVAQKEKGENRGVVLICGGLEGDAQKMAVINKIKGNLDIVAIQAPSFGDNRKDTLEDIAILCGGKVATDQLGLTWDSIGIEYWGQADKVTVSKDSTTIVGGRGNKKAIDDRCESLRNSLSGETDTFKKEMLQERLSKLKTGIAIIHVGASTDVEMRELKERVIDAVNATQAAMDQGVVPGGEVTLVKASNLVETKDGDKSHDYMLGHCIVLDSCLAPFNVLMSNSGLSRLHTEVLDSKIPNAGVDVMDGEIKNMVKAGIIDPVKVTISALQNAVSVAIMVMTTSCVIAYDVDITQEQKEQSE